jgi:hypothetical protein
MAAATELRSSGGVQVAVAIALSKSIRSSKVHRRGSRAMLRIPAGLATDGNAGKPAPPRILMTEQEADTATWCFG